LDEEDEEWALPEGVQPFLEETELYSETTAAVSCCSTSDLVTTRPCI
jgi:hypothetical protein